ncbi:MAG TPA: S-layer homology domain-containing protein [Clostridia bacterium]
MKRCKRHIISLFIGFTAAFLLYACCLPCTNATAAVKPPDIITPLDDISGEFTDPNFRQAVWEWLGKSGTPGKILAEQIRNRLPETDHILDVSERNIKDLSGLQFFKGLRSLRCQNNKLNKLPPLPDTLTELICRNNQLEKLPSLPDTLIKLNCYGNKITDLPVLPPSLLMLNCANNKLKSIPELPAGLKELICEINEITSLPDLPARLEQLSCGKNQLTELPDFPENMVVLTCELNQLTVLNDLPEHMITVYVQNNRLTSLPSLNDGLLVLNCSNNNLSNLPSVLPESLQVLDCSSNNLKSLPSLPDDLYQLSCSNNKLTELGSLPEGIETLKCNNNRLTEVPDIFCKIETLHCQYNYLDIMELLYTLDTGSVSDDRILTPQVRLNYTGGEITLHVGETMELPESLILQTCTFDEDGIAWSDYEDADISDITFHSYDTSKAIIDSDGYITGVGEGRCSIYALLLGLDSESAKAEISVNVLPGEEEPEELEEPLEPIVPEATEEEPGAHMPEEEPVPELQIDYASASEWAVEELRAAALYGLVTDKVNSLLKQDITREEFCSIAVKLYEALSGKKAAPVIYNPFTDTSDPEVLKAYQAGIVKGISADRFAPDYYITRQEICVMIYRAIKASKPGLDYSTTGVPSFADEEQIADWAIEEVRFASKNNIMKGTGGNKMSPLDNTTREQGIVLIKRTYESFKDK